MRQGTTGDRLKVVWACLPCNNIVELPMGGATTPHPTNTRTRVQGSPTGILEAEAAMSDGEISFSEAWNDLHPDYPFRMEYQFCLTREWRVDFAWVDEKVAVEYEGGGSFGHGRKNRYDSDVEKYNAMSAEGWLLFRCTKQILKSEIRLEKFIRMVAGMVVRRSKDLDFA